MPALRRGLAISRPVVLLCALVLSALAQGDPATPADAPQAAAGNVAGTWDMYWQTRAGLQQNSFMVIRQQGSAVTAEIHGQGKVKATGSITGGEFRLHGRKMRFPFLITGKLGARQLVGTVKILTVERHYSAIRRSGP